MSIDFVNFKNVRKFLDNEMTPSEEKAFLQQVNEDPELDDFLEFENDLNVYLLSKEFNKYTNALNYSDKDFNISCDEKDEKVFEVIKTKAKPAKVKRLFYYAAASVIIIAIAGSLNLYFQHSSKNLVLADHDTKKIRTDTIIFNSDKKINYSALANSYYKKDETPSTEPGKLSDLFKDYTNKDYINIQKLNPNIPNLGNNGNSVIKELTYYYKGLSYIETADNKGAIENLNWVAKNSKNEILQIKASWYLALTYLKTGEISTAAILFENISNNKKETFYKSKADNLLNRIK